MDDIYRHQRYIYDFTRKFYLFGRDDLIRGLALRPGESVVEVGCGTGRNLVKMARRYPHAKILGLDASSEMLKTARSAIARAGLANRVQLVHGFAEELSPGFFQGCPRFDHVVFSYSLSMIPHWQQALRRAAEVCDGGQIHIADFGGLNDVWVPVARLMRLWLSLFHVTPREEILQKLRSWDLQGEPGTVPRILPARYAFIWQGPSRTVQSLAL